MTKRVIVAALFAACLAACAGGGYRSSSGGMLPAAGAYSQSTFAAPTVAPSGQQIVADFSKLGPAVSPDVYGASQVTWTTITNSGTASILSGAGLKLIRWPGGSESDVYHWENGGTLCFNSGYIASGSTFDNFMQDDVIPANLDVAVTLDYGTNSACNAGGDPAEAAAWVAYAKSKGYRVSYWTVGNEVYGSWEEDLHTPAHDPGTYANAVATGYYPQIKAADSTAKVGVVVAGSYSPSWDQTVLQKAKYDFVELHYYAQAPGSESDSWLLDSGPQDFAANLSNLRSEMTANGAGSVPIYVGELNSVYSNPGKQTVSITEGLWAGMVLAEAMKQGVHAMTWWTAFGGCDTGNNDSSSLYGWQDFGTYTLFSDGIPTPYECPGISESIPFGTPFPAARAYKLTSSFAPPGSKLSLDTTVPSTQPLVRAYAARNGTGYALMLFNLSQTASTNVTVALSGASKSTFTVTSLRYGRAQYDKSKNNGPWVGPVTQSTGTVTFPYALALPPYSMTVLRLR